MEKILSLTVSIIIFIIVLFWVTGYVVGGNYSGEYDLVIDEPKGEVWDILIDYSNYTRARDDIESVETTGRYGDLFAWQENLDNGGYRKYRQTKREDKDKIVIELLDSSYNMTGTWEFNISERNGQSFIKIIETSYLNSTFMAGYQYYFTRNTETLAWVKLIKLRILGRLISSS